jgi:putative thioredoxin
MADLMHDVVDFNKEVMERSREIPVLVDFWAEWCGPCKVLGPVLERIAAESDGRWALAKVDTETHREVSAHYNVRSIPNVKLFIDGVVKAEFLGALPEPTVRQWLKKNLPGRYAKEIEQASRLVTEGNEEEARALLEGIVRHEPDNHRACVTLAQITLFSNPDNAIDIVRPIEEDSEVFDMAEAIRTVAARIGTPPDALPEGNARTDYAAAIADLRTRNYAGALEKFIGVIKNDRYYDDDGARKACIAIFKLLGEEHEVTQRFRREFGRALY